MNRCNEICSVCNSCTSSIQYACTCGDPVVFICKDCLVLHLSEQSTHTFISLLQARELVRNRISPEVLNKNLSKYNSIKLQIQKYITKLRTSKQDISEFKHQVITQIEHKCRSSVEILSSLEEKAQTQLQALKSRMKTFADAEDEFLSEFNSRG